MTVNNNTFRSNSNTPIYFRKGKSTIQNCGFYQTILTEKGGAIYTIDHTSTIRNVVC